MDLFSGAHGPFTWRPEGVFADLRLFNNPQRSRYVRLPNTTPDGGAFSYSREHGKTVVVGRDALRLVNVSDQGSAEGGESSSGPNTGPLSFAMGPGGVKADAGPNFWPPKLRTIQRMTDITWGPEAFNSKVLTSCSNGEVMQWDLGRGGFRLESSLAGGARSVNVVAAASHSPHHIATGSNDGSVKLWDLRHPRSPAFNLLSHGSAVRSLVFGQTSTLPVHVVLGLESGMIFRYDLRIKIDYLDRVVAHNACVHDLAWLPPSKDSICSGYLASGSLDQTVKIWPIEPSRISVKPAHTLHTPYPVGKIGWRPSFDTEIVVLPYHSNASGKGSSLPIPTAEPIERFAPQIWDIRKGWMAKWNLPSGDGPATDMYVADSYAVHILYRSGAFVQHDLHSVTRPYDAVPRQAVSWNASSSLFFVADKPRPFDPPYDDVHPSIKSSLPDYGMLDKAPGDRLSIITTQVIGSQTVPLELNRETYMKLARGYNHHDEDRVRMCKTNEDVARRAGQHEVAQTWALLGSLLTEIMPPKSIEPTPSVQAPLITPSVSAFSPLSAKDPPSATRSIPKSPLFKGQPNSEDLSPGFSLDALNASSSRRKGSGGASILPPYLVHSQKRRGSSPSLLSATRPGGTKTRSPSSSPVNQPVKLPPSTLGSASLISSSVVHPGIPRKISRSSGGKSKSHSHSPGPGSTLDPKSGWSTQSIVAEGALESGDSEDEGGNGDIDDPLVQSETSVDSSWSKEKKKVTRMGIQHPTLGSSSSSARSSPALGVNRPLPPSHLLGTKAALLSRSSSRLASPQSQLLNIQDVKEEDPDELDGPTDEEEDEVSTSSTSTHRKGQSSDDDHYADGIKVPSDVHLAQQSPPSPTLAKYIAARSTDSSRTTTIGRSGLKALTKQNSGSSLTTAYQVPAEGYVGSFGSNMMTPTMARINQPLPSSSFRPPNAINIGSMPVGIMRGQEKIPSNNLECGSIRKVKPETALPKSFAEVFIQGQPPSTIPNPSTPTGIPSTARSDSVQRSGSTGSKVNKGHGTVMSRSSIPPVLGSAGPDRESFIVNEKAGEERSERSVWIEHHEDIIRELERKEREVLWDILKGVVEGYANEGNVQMCAAMAIAAPEGLGIEPERQELFILAYLDQLMRMRLHLNAAYLRHNSPIAALKESTAYDTTNNVTCSRCGKEIIAHGPPFTVGRYAYCEKCKQLAVHCAICHLPVRKMLLFCHSCGHGGHQKCYQEFYTHQPPADLTKPRMVFPYTHVPVPEEGKQSRSGQDDEEGAFYTDEGRRVGPVTVEREGHQRGRRRDIRRAGSELEAGTASEREPSGHASPPPVPNGSSRGPVFGPRDGHSHPPPGPRSSSLADASTIMEPEQGLPDEEFMIVREREALEREKEREELKARLMGHFCASGCGHICWMSRR